MESLGDCKFAELVQKVGSIFGHFPNAKEIRLALLGLSEQEDLNDAMEDLVEEFGSDACDFALRVVQSKWRPFSNQSTIYEIDKINHNKPKEHTLDLLALLYYNAKSFDGELIFEAGKSCTLSPIVKLAITCVLKRNLQLKQENANCIGFTTCLVIKNRLSNQTVKETLDDHAFSGLFTRLFLQSCVFEYNGYYGGVLGEDEVTNDDIDRVLRMIREGWVEDLDCTSGGIPTYFTEGLIDVLKQGRLKKICFELVTWSNVNESIEHLCTGLEAFKEERRRATKDMVNTSFGIVEFKIREVPSSSGWGKDNICSLIKALGGISTLRKLHLYLDVEIPISLVQALSRDLLLHPQCRLVELNLGGRGIEKVDSAADADNDLNKFCNALAHCTSMRALKISCTPLDLTRLSKLFNCMASPGCRIEQFHLARWGIENTCDDIAVIAKSFENTNPHHTQPPRVRRIRCACIRQGIRKERLRQDLHTNLAMLRDKLPYLESCSPYCYKDIHRDWSCDNPDYVANADIISQIGLWQERNQCGRAFLLKTVAPTVPAGLWPRILKVAANKTSILTGNGPPTEGIYYLVHGLVAACIIGADSSGGAAASLPEATHSTPQHDGNECTPKRQRTN